MNLTHGKFLKLYTNPMEKKMTTHYILTIDDAKNFRFIVETDDPQLLQKKKPRSPLDIRADAGEECVITIDKALEKNWQFFRKSKCAWKLGEKNSTISIDARNDGTEIELTQNKNPRVVSFKIHKKEKDEYAFDLHLENVVLDVNSNGQIKLFKTQIIIDPTIRNRPPV